MLLQITFWIFITAFIIQMMYWLFLFSKLAFYKPAIKEKRAPGKEDLAVSIVICARNEAKNLKKNLDRILNQNYRSFEVIIVNDDSSDSTDNILLNYHIKYPILRNISLKDKPEGSGKKFALAQGIEAAKYEILLLTDADCVPNSNNWIRDMVSHLDDQTDIVLGYGPHYKAKSILNKWIRYETLTTATHYFSFALAGMPYMGVGRNLMYRKKLFREVGGFTDHDHLLSGDDDLFINAAATAKNTRIALESESFMYSEGKQSWKDYYRQKTRHLTAGKHYHLKHQILLGLYTLSHFLYYFGAIVLLILNFSTIFAVVILVYLVRISVIILWYRATFKKLQDTSLIYWVPFFDFGLILYYLVFSPVLMTGNTNRWK
ncbi:MAG: biofilm PGA synthesis N-glycosyltransferase PgaC [Saprospiraceae bacterium]|jgi:biofilm PGA synthesis N-glycosyltransferase PgaC